MNLYELTDSLIELALAEGLPARMDFTGGGYEVLWIDGIEVLVERTPKGYALAAYEPDTLETEQLAKGTPAKLLTSALGAFCAFRDKVRAAQSQLTLALGD